MKTVNLLQGTGQNIFFISMGKSVRLQPAQAHVWCSLMHRVCARQVRKPFIRDTPHFRMVYSVARTKFENSTNYTEKQLQSMNGNNISTMSNFTNTSVALPAMDMEPKPPAKRAAAFPVAEIYFFHCGDFLVAKLGFFCCWLFSCLGRFSRRKHEKNELKNNQPRCRKNA